MGPGRAGTRAAGDAAGIRAPQALSATIPRDGGKDRHAAAGGRSVAGQFAGPGRLPGANPGSSLNPDAHLLGVPDRAVRVQGQETRPAGFPGFLHARQPAALLPRGIAPEPALRAGPVPGCRGHRRHRRAAGDRPARHRRSGGRSGPGHQLDSRSGLQLHLGAHCQSAGGRPPARGEGAGDPQPGAARRRGNSI